MRCFYAIILAVRHDQFIDISSEQLRSMMNEKPVLIDIKGIFKDQKKALEDLFYYKI